MDAQRDFGSFREIVDDLNAVLRDGFKASDATVRGLFDALRDVPIEEIRANAKRIIATAGPSTRFPLPAALRNRPANIVAPTVSAANARAEREGIRRWCELRERDRVTFEIEFGLARAAYQLIGLGPEDPDYDEYERAQAKWQRLRFAPRAEQEAAVAKSGGRA
jgi:hypothetical protein